MGIEPDERKRRAVDHAPADRARRVLGLCQRVCRAQPPSTVEGGGLPESPSELVGDVVGWVGAIGVTGVWGAETAGACPGAAAGADAAAVPVDLAGVSGFGADLVVPGLVRAP